MFYSECSTTKESQVTKISSWSRSASIWTNKKWEHIRKKIEVGRYPGKYFEMRNYHCALEWRFCPQSFRQWTEWLAAACAPDWLSPKYVLLTEQCNVNHRLIDWLSPNMCCAVQCSPQTDWLSPKYASAQCSGHSAVQCSPQTDCPQNVCAAVSLQKPWWP